MADRTPPTRINVVLYDPDIEIVDAADTNDAGRSATIRNIIREWNDLQPLAQDAELLRSFAELDGTSVAETLHRILRTHLRQPARVLVDQGVEYQVEGGK